MTNKDYLLRGFFLLLGLFFISIICLNVIQNFKLLNTDSINCIGTGFFINGEGYIATVKHLFTLNRPIKSIKIKVNNNVYLATIVVKGDRNDVTILKIHTHTKFLQLNKNNTKNTPIAMIG